MSAGVAITAVSIEVECTLQSGWFTRAKGAWQYIINNVGCPITPNVDSIATSLAETLFTCSAISRGDKAAFNALYLVSVKFEYSIQVSLRKKFRVRHALLTFI
jgi:hypothetical protein